ncbi:MAG: C1 family peptidase, partial [Spirochaetales bacterium]|nr:C1 family peptidase [Spirochaetales bacterium]
MRHFVHLMFGRVSVETLLNLKQYVLKYGDPNALPYFSALHIHYDGDSFVVEEAVPDAMDTEQVPFEDTFRVHYEVREKIDKNNTDAIRSFLIALKRNKVNADHPGDYAGLHYCIHVPLFQEEIWEQARVFIDLIHQDVYPVPVVDVLGYCGDMADVFLPKEEVDYDTCVKTTSYTLKQICDFNKESNAIQHIIAIDNKQNSGVSLKLNQNTLVAVLGDFALLAIECYPALFEGLRDDKELCAMGLSTMSIDRFFFVEYLLKRTFRYVLDREQVNVTEVDYNKMSQLSDTILTKWIHLMSELYQKEVKPRRQLKKDDQTIIVEILPILNEQFKNFVKEIDETSHSENLSIPEKRAFLAVFLGLDDPSLVNDVFNEEQLIINDLERESIRLFIDSNNALLGREATEDDALLSVFLNPSDPKEEVFYPLDLIKKNRISIKHCVGTIRELQKNEEKLKTQLANQAESEKCLIQNGVITYNGQAYKLLPVVADPPLQEQYVAHPVTATSVDLRGNFTSVKNQGALGSCLSHALVSIYEYFLRCNGLNAPDLSELFLYYNARLEQGDEAIDEGSNIQASMSALSTQGICMEEEWPYAEDKFRVRPPDSAYQDAATRKVKESLNVALTVDDIKSALEDGFPVAISVNLYESFTSGHGGFIPLPAEDEKQSENHGRHAMVICGFSEEDKLFIVRNSWGTQFGDAGYCYMPYAYITNPDLTNWAAIIKEIVTAGEVPASGPEVNGQSKVFSIKAEKRAHVNFDHADASIMLMVTQAGLVEQQSILDHLLGEDRKLQAYYAKLKQQLIDKNLQNRLKDATINRLNLEAKDIKEKKQRQEDEKTTELESFDKGTLRKFIVGGIIILVVTLCGFFTSRVVKRIQKDAAEKVKVYTDSVAVYGKSVQLCTDSLSELNASIDAKKSILETLPVSDSTGVRAAAEEEIKNLNSECNLLKEKQS